MDFCTCPVLVDSSIYRLAVALDTNHNTKV
uniref:Uncharacterized protein n=1 Tax=Anguilla anguilla TaxID=7936 RepID=A0A0E9VE65_ANGAN